MSTIQVERPPALDNQALDDIFAAIAERAASSAKNEPVVAPTPSRQSKQAPSFRAVQPRPRETPQAIPTDSFDVLSRIVMVGCVAGLIYLLLTGFSWSPLRKPRTERAVQSIAVVSQPTTRVVVRDIDTFDVGMRAAGKNPLRGQVESAPEPDPETSRKLVLQMKKESGHRLTVKLLRSLEWIELVGVVEGGTFFLDLPEMGAVGDAYVEAVLPCPLIEKGPGNVVTGVFAHEADPDTKILSVTFANGAYIKGVTNNHPFYSVDRNDFVEVGLMREGETVKVEGGVSRITKIDSRFARPGEMLYNLETHNEHVFQVTTAGILVHNDCLDYAKNVLRRRPDGAVIRMEPLPPRSFQTGTLPGYPVSGRNGMGSLASGDRHYFHLENGILRDPAHPRGILIDDWIAEYSRLNNIAPNEVLDFFNFLPHLPGN